MGYEPKLIAPFKSSLVNYYEPWIIGEDAFPSLSNVYTWRGSVRKREGYYLFAVLPGGDSPVQGIKNWINPSTLSATSVVFSTTKSYFFNTGSDLYQDITFLAKPAGMAFPWSNTTNDYFWTSNFAASMWTTNNLIADHIRFWTGVTGAVGVSGGWSIHQPTVNGTTTLDASLLVLPYKGRLVVLNTSEGGNTFPARARWSQIGTPYTSNSPAVGITGITPGVTTVINIPDTSSFTIGLPAGITLVIGSIGAVLNFNQFIVLSIVPNVSITIDVDTTGLTYTSDGMVQGPGTTVPPDPYQISIFGWRDDIPGRGGFVDADTSERIVTADIVKDILIVFFQRSTWRLRYTGNEILPFIWERLNTQYGAESTYSNIPFDEAVLAFSRYGWIACDTNEAARIDLNIPDNSFSIDATNTGLTGLTYVQGIRDYYRQFAYWTFPNQDLVNPDNQADQIYAYNYIDKTWSIFTPSVGIRTFGTYVETDDKTWGNLSASDDKWRNFNQVNEKWELLGSSQNNAFPVILGGDVNGNIYKMFAFQQSPFDDNDINFGFDLLTKRFNPYISKGLKCRIGYVDIYCTTVPGGEITFNQYVDDQTAPVFSRNVVLSKRVLFPIVNITPGAVTTITTNSIIYPPNGLTTGQLVTITDVVGTMAAILNNNTFVVTVIDDFNFTIPIDTTTLTWTSAGSIALGNIPGSGQLLYTRVYLGAIAHMHQFEITLTDAQVNDPVIGTAQFELQGLVLWTKPAGRIRG